VYSEDTPSPQEVAGAESVILNFSGSTTPPTGAAEVAVPAARSRLSVAETSRVDEAVGVMVAVGGSGVFVAVDEGGGVVAVGVAGLITESITEQPTVTIRKNDSTKPRPAAGFFIAENLPRILDTGSFLEQYP